MAELNTEKLIKETNDDEIKCMLYNIETYKDMNDYTHYTNTTKEDLKELQADGWIQDITPGTYNGALDKTDYSELTLSNIYDALFEESKQDSFQYLLEYQGESASSEARQVRLATEYYTVFTIGKHLYMTKD